MQAKEMQQIQDAIDCVLDMADDGLAHYEDEDSITVNESIAKAVAIKRVRHYLFRLQECLAVIKKEAQTICIPKTEFTYADWADASASAKNIEKMADNLILKECA